MKIQVENIEKSFGSKLVLRGLSTTLDFGHFTGILGPNGAGKSTLMKIITGQMLPTAGEVFWRDDENQLLTSRARAAILGYVHQSSVLDNFLTVRENLISRGALRSLAKSVVLERITELNRYLDIESILDSRYAHLSGGQKRRVDIIAAMIHKPKLLILDEPTTGIDPEIREELWQEIFRLRDEEELSIILITHYLEEMAHVDNLVILLDGTICYQGDLEHFIHENSQDYLILTRTSGETCEMPYTNVYEKIQIIERAYFLNHDLLDFTDSKTSLEKAYLKMLKGHRKGSSADD